ncbi:MAG: Wzz/FepE/Etk N-terminal domain-containing protein [Treponemataceae bacterium]|nr:Wzz/FepE/Etk N-terminal domain-containing protein [Treponemataceae bacterium]
MEENKIQDDEISLIDLFAVLWRYKVMIIVVTLIAMIGVVVYSVISLKLPPEKSFLPNKYTAQAQMLINNDSSSSGGLSSMLNSSGLGGLANLAGVSVPGGASNSSLAGYLVHSNSVLDEVVKNFNLVERYNIEEYVVSASRDALKGVLTSNFDDETGIFSVSFTDIDPVFAKDVVNFVVSLLESKFLEMGIDKNSLTKENLEANIENTYNEILKLQKEIQEIEYSVSNVYNPNQTKSIVMDATLKKMELSVQQEIYAQLKAQYEMLKVTMSSEQPVFQILEFAEVPDRKSAPSRGMLCIIVTFAAFFVSVFMAFLLNALKNIKNDPVAMSKLKGK